MVSKFSIHFYFHRACDQMYHMVSEPGIKHFHQPLSAFQNFQTYSSLPQLRCCSQRTSPRMLDKASGIEVYARPTDDKDPYEELEIVNGSPLSEGIQNAFCIEITNEKQFCPFVKIPQNFDFGNSSAPKIEYDVDHGKASVEHIIRNSQPWEMPYRDGCTTYFPSMSAPRPQPVNSALEVAEGGKCPVPLPSHVD